MNWARLARLEKRAGTRIATKRPGPSDDELQASIEQLADEIAQAEGKSLDTPGLSGHDRSIIALGLALAEITEGELHT